MVLRIEEILQVYGEPCVLRANLALRVAADDKILNGTVTESPFNKTGITKDVFVVSRCSPFAAGG